MFNPTLAPHTVFPPGDPRRTLPPSSSVSSPLSPSRSLSRFLSRSHSPLFCVSLSLLLPSFSFDRLLQLPRGIGRREGRKVFKSRAGSCKLGVACWDLGVWGYWRLRVRSWELRVGIWNLGVTSWDLGVWTCELGFGNCKLAFGCSELGLGFSDSKIGPPLGSVVGG